MTVKLVVVEHGCTQPNCGPVVRTVGPSVNIVNAYTLQDAAGTILYWGRPRHGMTAKENALSIAARRGWTVLNA